MIVHRIGTVLAAALVTLAGGCATVKVNMYDADEVEAIETWHIDFSYEPGEYQQAIGTRRGATTTIIKQGYPPVDLQLRDDLLFALRDSHATTLVRNKEDAEGFIRLLPQHFTGGGYKSLQMLLTDVDREVLARIRVNNGGTNPIIKRQRQVRPVLQRRAGQGLEKPIPAIALDPPPVPSYAPGDRTETYSFSKVTQPHGFARRQVHCL